MSEKLLSLELAEFFNHYDGYDGDVVTIDQYQSWIKKARTLERENRALRRIVKVQTSATDFEIGEMIFDYSSPEREKTDQPEPMLRPWESHGGRRRSHDNSPDEEREVIG
jgi:hypothetical protein